MRIKIARCLALYETLNVRSGEECLRPEAFSLHSAGFPEPARMGCAETFEAVHFVFGNPGASEAWHRKANINHLLETHLCNRLQLIRNTIALSRS